MIFIDYTELLGMKLTVFLELRSWEAVHFSEHIISADKYPCLFSRQTEIVCCFLSDATHLFVTSNFIRP